MSVHPLPQQLPALMHLGEGSSPDQWTWDPMLIVGIGLFVTAYLYGIGILRRRHEWAERVGSSQVICFVVGTIIFFLALASPIEVLGEQYLFSAHMVQHLLIVMVAAPLFLLGTPEWLMRPLVRSPIVRKVGRVLTFPAVAFVIFNANFWLWHLPVLYNLALADEQVHIFQHLTFVSTAVINWWPVFSPLPELPPLSYPGRLGYLFFNCQPNVALGAILTFSSQALYAPYAEAPRLFGLSPPQDQQLGGLIMWIPGNLAYLFALSVIFIVWFSKEPSEEERTG